MIKAIIKDPFVFFKQDRVMVIDTGDVGTITKVSTRGWLIVKFDESGAQTSGRTQTMRATTLCLASRLGVAYTQQPDGQILDASGSSPPAMSTSEVRARLAKEAPAAPTNDNEEEGTEEEDDDEQSNDSTEEDGTQEAKALLWSELQQAASELKRAAPATNSVVHGERGAAAERREGVLTAADAAAAVAAEMLAAAASAPSCLSSSLSLSTSSSSSSSKAVAQRASWYMANVPPNTRNGDSMYEEVIEVP
eukprot:CAMPEP_0171705816 /NCGR_PEP_ID=MMETSP0991-20121206/13403_1 /TAXON_ID=483369 /ORGANISM="non described non described, Strain CCMP2098" /LENGTH=249 /DNA_ID=CAMNT_0012295395 /DNA_START=98 /DNA_END=844 /DNA_ORIENTATION=+